MKYFTFLARFVVPPLLAFTGAVLLDRMRGKRLPPTLNNYPEAGVLAAHVAVAVAYTTPWDNYIVANKVWWYDPKKVHGLTIGWVPIEEYTFFVLQSLMSGAWTLWWAARLPSDAAPISTVTTHLPARVATTSALGVAWMASVAALFSRDQRKDYLALMTAWALPPIMIQTLLGADILWRHRRLALLGIIPTTLYLAAADSIAIGHGTWTINPKKITNIHLPNKLPLEEGLFFLLTNVLLVFGIILVLSPESEGRLPSWLRGPYDRLKARLVKRKD
jgi:lycopene beta-cyclase